MDDLMTTAAAALVSKTAEAAAAAGLAAVARLHQLVKERFSRSPVSQAALEQAQADPGDQASVATLANTLALAAEQDPSFVEALTAVLPQATRELAGTRISNTVNSASNSTITQIGAIIQRNV